MWLNKVIYTIKWWKFFDSNFFNGLIQYNDTITWQKLYNSYFILIWFDSIQWLTPLHGKNITCILFLMFGLIKWLTPLQGKYIVTRILFLNGLIIKWLIYHHMTKTPLLFHFYWFNKVTFTITWQNIMTQILFSNGLIQ